MTRFLLVTIQPRLVSEEDMYQDLLELQQLVTAFGGHVADVVVQRREVHDKGMYLGRGKIDEVAQRLKADRIDVVVLNAIVKPGQLYEMKTRFLQELPEIEVWDRVDLILQIFSQHANTAEARLQIELAAMRHMGPRIYGMGMEMSRQTGGIGGRGIGETNTELMKRHWQRQMKAIETKLEKLASARMQQLDRRRKLGYATVSLIGYTNAGKTSLFNRLVGKKKLTSDALFVTLDSSVGRLFLPQSGREVLLADTIGFIQNLPAELIESFRSTLMEALHADLLIQVVDAADPEMDRKMEAVNQVLQDLNLTDCPRIVALNKLDIEGVDQQAVLNRYHTWQPLVISAATGEGIPALIDYLDQQLSLAVRSEAK
jgi:GTP-binding protein HflX